MNLFQVPGNQLKIKKDGSNILQSLPGFFGALEVQPHRSHFVKSPGPHLVEANVPAIQDEPLEEQAEYDDMA